MGTKFCEFVKPARVLVVETFARGNQSILYFNLSLQVAGGHANIMEFGRHLQHTGKCMNRLYPQKEDWM